MESYHGLFRKIHLYRILKRGPTGLLESSPIGPLFGFHFPKTKSTQCSRVVARPLALPWDFPDGRPFVKSKKLVKMKKVYLALMAIGLNLLMFSCTQGDIAEDATLYHTVATEGDDDDPPVPPPEDED